MEKESPCTRDTMEKRFNRKNERIEVSARARRQSFDVETASIRFSDYGDWLQSSWRKTKESDGESLTIDEIAGFRISRLPWAESVVWKTTLNWKCRFYTNLPCDGSIFPYISRVIYSPRNKGHSTRFVVHIETRSVKYVIIP